MLADRRAQRLRGRRHRGGGARRASPVPGRNRPLRIGNTVEGSSCALLTFAHDAVMLRAMTKLPAHVIREIAVRARRDPRTVERVVDGREVRPLAAADVRDAMKELGIE